MNTDATPPMNDKKVTNVVIVGGGTAGWIAAASLAKTLGQQLNVQLVESDDIGIVGVGEATIPQIRRLNAILGFDEFDFIKKTKATFKLGIEFNNWGAMGDSYLHTFGEIGINLGGVHFHHYWVRAQQNGLKKSLWDYSLHQHAADANAFGQLEKVGNTPMSGLAYAFHFDAGLYAKYLRTFAEGIGVKRTEGIVEHVNQHADSGHIESVVLKSGQHIEGDLFIDCSGFRALLIEKTLGVGYQDWSHWLPCNSAAAVPSETVKPLIPFTKATAHDAGWQWRIPLQHRVGNGHVFSNNHIDDEQAIATLLANLDGQALAEPRILRFNTGRREQFWSKNCVSLGLASGFLEPLESTSIHLIQSNVGKLINLFPHRGIAQSDITEYNRQVGNEYELVRDFIILHYKLTRRDDSEFWRYCRHMEIPTTLQSKIDLFASGGRVFREPDDLFRDTSWVLVMLGQGVIPRDYSAMAGNISDEQLNEFLSNVEHIAAQAAGSLPKHDEFIARHCASLPS